MRSLKFEALKNIITGLSFEEQKELINICEKQMKIHVLNIFHDLIDLFYEIAEEIVKENPELFIFDKRANKFNTHDDLPSYVYLTVKKKKNQDDITIKEKRGVFRKEKEEMCCFDISTHESNHYIELKLDYIYSYDGRIIDFPVPKIG